MKQSKKQQAKTSRKPTISTRTKRKGRAGRTDAKGVYANKLAAFSWLVEHVRNSAIPHMTQIRSQNIIDRFRREHVTYKDVYDRIVHFANGNGESIRLSLSDARALLLGCVTPDALPTIKTPTQTKVKAAAPPKAGQRTSNM